MGFSGPFPILLDALSSTGLKLTIFKKNLHPRRVFRIARARRSAVVNVFVALSADGITGYGEASPNSFYDETAEGVSHALRGAKPWIEGLRVRSVSDIEHLWNELWARLAPSRAAQCAVDLALWDWLAKAEQTSVGTLLWGRNPAPVATFCTLGLSTPEELGSKIDELEGFPLVKLKSDQTADLAPVRHVRSRSRARIAVDANGSWSPSSLGALSSCLETMGVEFLEQPLPDSAAREWVAKPLALPVMADESCVTEADLDQLPALYSGFNIKLVKCGGLTAGARMARKGAERGLSTMVGCMLESSLLIGAGAALAQGTKYADLDGAWLLSDDPFDGWRFESGMLEPGDPLGFGAEPKPGVFSESADTSA